MIILYSTNCPKCKILEKKLKEKNIEFLVSNDINKLIERGFQEAPVLQIDEEYMNFGKAVKWINEH